MWEANENLRRRHFLLKFGRGIWLEGIKHWSLGKQLHLILHKLHIASKQGYLTIPCMVFAVRCSFESVSPNNMMMPALMSLFSSVKIKTKLVLCLGLVSGFSSSRALCLWISTRLSSLDSRSWKFSSSKTSSASYVEIQFSFRGR